MIDLILHDFLKESKIIRFFVFKVVNLSIFENIALEIHFNT